MPTGIQAIADAIARQAPEGAQAALRTRLSGTPGSLDNIRARDPRYATG